MRKLPMWAAIIVAGAALTGCVAGDGGSVGRAAESAGAPVAADFTLRVLPESFAPGGEAEIEHRVRGVEGGAVVVEIYAEARRLKALHVEMNYDPQRFTPTAAQATGALADGNPDGLLELAVLHHPGTAYHSQVLVHYVEQPGLTGPALLAELQFARGAFRRQPDGVSRQNSASWSTIPAAMQLRQHDQRAPIGWDREAGILRVYYGFAGDYDQNGEVNGADIVPVAAHFRKTAQTPTGIADSIFAGTSVESVIDGDGNGEINAADLSRIAANFGRRFGGYEVFQQDGFGAPYPKEPRGVSGLTAWREVGLEQLRGERGKERLHFEIETELNLTGKSFWAEGRTVDGAPAEQTQIGLALPTRDLDFKAPQLYDPSYGLAYDAANQVLSWFHTLPGDLDGNGEVNPADIIRPVAHFGQQVPSLESALWAVDSFRDGVIDGYDLLLMRRFWLSRVTDYCVFVTEDPDAVPYDPYAPESLQPLYSTYSYEYHAPEMRRRYQAILEIPSGAYVWVRGYHFEQAGVRSEIIQVP